jgi:hypothetical protein
MPEYEMETSNIASAKKKFKIQPSVGKVMLTLLWFSQGLILEHCQERGALQ